MIIAHVKPTDQQKAEIDALLAAKRPATLEALAAKLEVTPLEAAQLLDPDMCAFVTGEASEIFDDVWASLAAWERATLFIVSGAHVFEIDAKLAAGKRTFGYYNILNKNAVVGGHIKYEALGAIAFVSIPFMQLESHCVIFFDKEGNIAFSVYVGRENHQLIDSVKEAFFAGRKAFCESV